MKNPQFLPESAETLPIVPIHELVVFTKFQDNQAKIVDFSLRAYSGACLIFYSPVSSTYVWLTAGLELQLASTKRQWNEIQKVLYFPIPFVFFFTLQTLLSHRKIQEKNLLPKKLIKALFFHKYISQKHANRLLEKYDSCVVMCTRLDWKAKSWLLLFM